MNKEAEREKSQASHLASPGQLLEEKITEKKLAKRDFAQRLGIPIEELEEIFAGKRFLSATMAMKIERELGTPSEYWIRHQAQYLLEQEKIKQERFLNGE